MPNRERTNHSPRVTPEQYRELLRRKLATAGSPAGSDGQVINDITTNQLEASGGMPSDMSLASNMPGRMAMPGLPQPPNAPSRISMRSAMSSLSTYAQAAAPGQDPQMQALMSRLMARGQEDSTSRIAAGRAALPQSAPPNIDAILKGIYERAQ